MMERMLVAVFDDESKAYDGFRALTELDSEGSISIHSQAVIKREENGKVILKQSGGDFPLRTVGGTAIGALIGLLGGPVGLGIGAVAGTFTGGILDMHRAGVNAEFLDDVSAKLAPGKWAVVADVNEEWVAPFDTRMEALGGFVYRTTREYVEDEQNAQEKAAMKADIAQLKVELAKSRAEQKAKIQSRIDDLNKKLHAKFEQAKKRLELQEEETRVKVQALQNKAAKASGEAKASIEARIAEIKKKSKESRERHQELWAEENKMWA